MRRLFLRTYLVLAAVVIGGLLVVTAWDVARRRPADPDVVRTLLEAPDDVRAAFASASPETAASALARDLGVDVTWFSADHLPPHVPPRAQARLQRGASAGPVPGRPPELWVPVPEAGLVVHLVPRGGRPPPVPWVAAAVLVLLGVAVAGQLVPLDRDLQALSDAAGAFGAGERDVRATLRPGSAAADLGARFNTMADRIASLLDAQRDLLLAVSHELRTPLNRVRFSVELLAGEADPAARDRLAEALQGDLDELDGLVAELLTFGRLEQVPPVAREPVRLAELVQSLVDDAGRERDALEVSVDVDPAAVVQVDPAAYRRAATNLVRNAVRHARARIRISTETGPEGLHLHVDDDGPGIPLADRARVLEPFVRLDDARSRDAGGAGLGLALAARIAEVHGGRVTVGDAPIGGARLTLTVPLTQADAG